MGHCSCLDFFLQASPLLLVLLLVCSRVDRADAYVMVTGTVFCDQCRDGKLSLFDYPLFGAKVELTCAGYDGQTVEYAERTTNPLGTYGIRLDGDPDLSRCGAKVVSGPDGCGSGTGFVQGLSLLFSFFGTSLYSVNPLLAQPDRPRGFCQPSGSAPSLPPPVLSPPPTGDWHLPPVPSLRAFACPYMTWTAPEHRCYWKFVSPNTKVALLFGVVAGKRYGFDMTLWEGLQGKGDLYRTLLREGTTALLNSHHNIHFFYPTLTVILNMNKALLGSPRQALDIALRFRRANYGEARYGNATCNFTLCGN